MNELAAYEVAAGEGQAEALSPRVLVIDESPAICDMLCQALELAGYCATSCASGKAWIDCNRQSDDVPALILLDLSTLPMKRTAFLQRLREQWKSTPPPIIVMTTSKEIDDLAGEQVFHKPFHVCDLLVEVRRLLPLPSEPSRSNT